MAEGQDFITRGQFKKLSTQKKEEDRDVTNWADISTETIFRIKQVEKKIGKFGDCHIITAISKTREEIKVWAPKKLLEEFQEEEKKKKTRALYFISLGQVRKTDGSGHSRNMFDSCFSS